MSRAVIALTALGLLTLPGCSPATVSALSSARTTICSPAVDSTVALAKRKILEVQEGKKALAKVLDSGTGER